MPFGKYEGDELKDIPTEYLVWVKDNCKDIENDLWEAIDEEIDSRYDEEKFERARGKKSLKRFRDQDY